MKENIGIRPKHILKVHFNDCVTLQAFQKKQDNTVLLRDNNENYCR